MTDRELDRLRRRRYAELRKRLQIKTEDDPEQKTSRDVLNRIFIDRAWEVYNATLTQYPHHAERLSAVLVQLASSGRIKKVSGEDLYLLLQQMGIRVKLKTTIRIKERGKLKSIEEKIKGEH